MDLRSLAVLVLLIGAVLCGWLRYFRPGSARPPEWERTVVPLVHVGLVIGLYVWQIADP